MSGEVPTREEVLAPFQRPDFWFWKLFTSAFFGIFGPLDVRGAENLPEGGCLVLVNHLSDVDPFAVMSRTRRPIRFMAKAELFSIPGIAWGLRHFGCFAVRRGESDRAPLKLAAELIKSGQPVGVFPEGELSESGHLQELKAGVALILKMAPCPVILCALEGTNRVMPYGKMIPRPSFRRVRVRWGEPRVFTADEAKDLIPWATEGLRALGAP